MTTPAIASITFDCRNAGSLARFWADLLRRSVAPGASDAYAALEGGPPLTFIAVPEDKRAKNRMHLDVAVTDLESEERRAVELGASRGGAFDEGGYRWITLTDPEGNEFDLVVLPS
jgi:glyoxalase superfamily protein